MHHWMTVQLMYLQRIDGFRDGLLFAVHRDDPVIVPVPFNFGVRPDRALVEDLWVHSWVPTRIAGLMDFDSYTHTVASFNSIQLANPYTIVFCPLQYLHSPTHNESALTNGLGTPWWENVLVVKHSTDGHPLDVVDADIEEITKVTRS
jgi:hypothetical protein